MNVGAVQEYKLAIGEKEYIFRLDFKALKKFNDKYNNWRQVPVTDKDDKIIMNGEVPVMRYEKAMDIFNRLINTPGDYEDLIKLLSCSCINNDISEEELNKSLSLDFPTLFTLEKIQSKIITGSITLKPKEEKKNNQKN